jgi:hypothetical protein
VFMISLFMAGFDIINSFCYPHAFVGCYLPLCSQGTSTTCPARALGSIRRWSVDPASLLRCRFPKHAKGYCSAVKQHGEKWRIVSTQVGRTDMDCRDRYRNHLKHCNVQLKGKSMGRSEHIILLTDI